MPTVSQLLNVVPQNQLQPQQQQTGGSSLLDTLGAVGGASLGAVASVGNFLDLPGSSIRDLLAGEGLAKSFDQWLSPLSDKNRVSGRQLLERRFGMRANRETGMTGWLSDPGEGLRDLAGFGAEVLLDPFGPLTKGTKMATGAASLVDRAHPVVKGAAKGFVNIFDRLPAGIGQTTKRVLTDKAKDVGRGLKAMFNAPSGGVTDAIAQGVKERATVRAEKAKELANLMSIDLVETANRSGFNLQRNSNLDMNDPANWLADDSPLVVSAREQQIFRFWEGTYDPTSARLRSGDLVMPEGSNSFKEVEWIDRSSTGTKVKLVNDDRLYNDFDFDPKKQWLSQSVEIPPELHKPLADMARHKNDIRDRLREAGGIIGDIQDPYIEHISRRKSTGLARAEQIGGLSFSKWVRNKYSSLVSTLMAQGGRDITYRAFRDGTPGIEELYGDKNFQRIVEEINEMATGTGANNGAKFLPGFVGPRHIQEFAEAIGMDPEDLWTRMQQMQPVNATNTRAFSMTPGVFTVVRDGKAVDSIGVDIAEGVARVNVAGMADTTGLPDALHDVAQQLARGGSASRLEVSVPPSLADTMKPLGYVPEGINPDGTERLVRKLFRAEDTYSTINSYLPVEEFKARFNGFVAGFAEQVRRGEIEGVQPGRGWYKSYTDYRPGADGSERVFNLSPKDLTRVDMNNILNPDVRGMFTHRNDWDQAAAIVQNGGELYVGLKKTKGKPAELLLLKPTQKHQIELQHKKLVEKLDQMLLEDPLTQMEAITDSLHNAIIRNYSDKVDRWMPEMDEYGGITASDVSGAFTRKAGLKEWQNIFSRLNEGLDTIVEGSPYEALLRLDDDSLQALMFTQAQKDRLASIRSQWYEQADVIQDAVEQAKQKARFEQNMSVGLVDRHRGLAIDLSENVERRFNRMYEASAVVSNLEYMQKNTAALQLLDEMKQFIGRAVVDARTNPNAFGARRASGNVEVDYDLASKRGMSFEDAVKEGFFGENVSDSQFIESVRQFIIENKALKPTNTADAIAKRLETAGNLTEAEVATLKTQLKAAKKSDADELARQIAEIKSLRLPSETWGQLKTFNEISNAANMPELDAPYRWMQNINTLTKAGQLSTAPATGVRDGMSSYVQGVLMGDMDPFAILKHGKAAWSFTKGTPIDPGEGIADIEQYLVSKGIPSTAESRGRAFQDMFNAHHAGRAPNPDVVTADEFRLAETDTSMAVLKNKMGGAYASMLDRIKNAPQSVAGAAKMAVTSPIQATKTAAKKAVSVQGMWTTDELGRQVQRSVGENPLVNTMNDFRSIIDSTVRTTFILDRVKKTKSMAQALADADRILLNADPKNFTRFEHKFMKSAIPYYSFMRQTLPLFASEMMVNPGGKLGMAIRATRLGQGGEGDYVPYQYLDSTAIPLGQTDDGQLKYLTSLGLMHEDAVKYAGNALQRDWRGLMQHALSSANPAAKWVIEASTNTSLFSQGPMGGRRLDDLDPTMGRIALNLGLQSPNASGRPTPVGGPLAESIAAMSPVSRLLSSTKIATDKRLSPLEKVARLTTGFREEVVDREQVIRDLRDRLNAMQIKLGARPLTIVSGAEKLKEFALAQGDTETAAQLEQIEKALALQKKLDRETEKKTKEEPARYSRKALIDRLRALR